ncbi:MAG: MotA/TolQ/ExbB proton channel family protein [Nitrospira sp.]|nr:MotA/TolQ/ExbB proton channel family protein [Nitrospira sp.]
MIQILMGGGWMMIPILGCSLLALTICIERGFQFRSLRFSRLADRMIKLVEQGKWTDALALAEQRQSPTLRVLSAGIFHRDQQPDKAMEAAGIAEVSRLKRGLSVLDTVITLGPLLGLLGTIIGMIDSFGIMSKTGLGNPHAVTGGVAEALICTAAGIGVAVITLIPYNMFLSMVERETERIEQYATKLQSFLGHA